MTRAAAALDAAISRVPTPAASHELALAFESLGEEVQAECHLSLK
jgi:hypothetical protein